jgi:galactose-1-phosphate uridylyltransferase
MHRIVFEKNIREFQLLNPTLNFRPDVQPVEFRMDPLTGDWCRLGLKRIKRVKQVEEQEHDATMDIVESSRKSCPFCPENLERRTPRFPSDLLPDGRFKTGPSQLFPNLFPFGEHHAVAVFSQAHYMSLNEFSSEVIRNCTEVAARYFRTVRAKSPEMTYCLINWNHMPPAGASFIHPHLQILADRMPTNRLDELLRESRKYHENFGSSYWKDLVATEKEVGERFIGETGAVTWIASYAPQGNNEVVGIFSNISTVCEMEEPHIEGLSKGLSQVLRAYNEVGVRSFNMTLFSGPEDQHLKYYSLNVKLISRPSLRRFYTSDSGFMERLHYETVVETKPEDVAQELRRGFQSI